MAPCFRFRQWLPASDSADGSQGTLVLGPEAGLLQGADDYLLMTGTEGFHGDGQFHRLVSVDADKLIVLELNDISLFFCDHLGYFVQLARDIRQIYGYGTPTRRANREIRLWNRNDDAKAVQAYLMAIELLRTPTVCDQMDEKAVKAVKEYQRQNGLHVTGTVDLETRQMMEKDPLFRQLVVEMHE